MLGINEKKDIREEDELAVLYRINKLVSQSNSIQEITTSVVDILIDLLGAKEAHLLILDEENNLMNYGKEKQKIPLQEYNLAKEVLQNKKISVLKDFEKKKLLRGEIENFVKIYLPLAFKKEPIGVIAIKGLKDGITVKDQDISFLQMLSNEITLAIVNTKLQKAREKKISELSSIYEITKTISSTLDLEKALTLILLKATDLLNAEAGAILLYNKEKTAFEIKASIGKDTEKIMVNEGVASEVALKKEAQLINEKVDEGKVNSLLCCPLKLKEEVIGVIEVSNEKAEKGFNDEDTALLTSMAEQAAIAIENARLYEEIRIKAITDHLTKIFNRHYFMEKLEEEIKRADRYKKEFSLIILDIDFFKKYNDTNGHVAGDMLLKQFAQVLTKGVREVDIVARYGGEEFIILLPETGKEAALLTARRLRESIEKERFENEEKQPNGNLTASIGVTTYSKGKLNAQQIIDNADKALYMAKESGRNRVVLDPNL